MTSDTGERIGRYGVVRRLAAGGMAEIFLARHDGPNGFHKLVVIKQMLPEMATADGFQGMFRDEGRLSARLSHPNIAQTFEVGTQDGRDYIALEYVEGESLDRLVKRARAQDLRLPEGAVLRVVMLVLEALDYTHDLEGEGGEWLKVVHRDVSPSNVVVTYYGSVKLLDFGIARAVSHEHHTQAGKVKGKGGYMSPEQASGKAVDLRTDIYAVGSLLYYLSTGKGAFDQQATPFLMMKATVDGKFPPPRAVNPQVSVELEKIILKAMALQPADRFQTAGEMLDALEQYSVGRRLFPGARALAALMRTVFPGRVGLARSWEQTPSAALVDKLAESFVDPDDAAPTNPARAGAPPPPPPESHPAPHPLPEPQRMTLPEPHRPASPQAAPGRVAPLVPLGAEFAFDDTGEEDRTIQVGDPKQLLAQVRKPPTAPETDRTVSIPDPKPLLSPPRPPPTESDRTVSIPAGLSLAGREADEDRTRSILPLPRRPVTVVTAVGGSLAKHPWYFAAVGLLAVALGLLVLKLFSE